MSDRKVLLYYAWSRPDETHAPLEEIDDRFPALFELRRLHYPRFEEISDRSRFDQGIGGFLDLVQKPNFARFVELARELTGTPAVEVERVLDDGTTTELSSDLIDRFDTVIVISFDSFRTRQVASRDEITAVRQFLGSHDRLIFVCPHHDIGEDELTPGFSVARQTADFLHHGDKSIPPRQGFGRFARSLLDGLGVPVVNRFGLRPAIDQDGFPAPIETVEQGDRLALLKGVRNLNLHPHLPQLERLGDAIEKLAVLARQPIDLTAPPHPFTANGRRTFDAILQSREKAFAGTLLVSDTTLWSSTAGGIEMLERLWSNVLARPRRL